MGEATELDATLERLSELLAEPEAVGVGIVSHAARTDPPAPLEAALRSACRALFDATERVARRQAHLLHRSRGRSAPPPSLSTVATLHLDPATADAETVWAQVDAQTAALLRRLQKSTRQLQRMPDTAIRLLQDDEDSEEEGSGRGSDEDEHDDDLGGNDVDDDDDDDDDAGEGAVSDDSDKPVDEEVKRMRDRMKRAMAETDSDSEEDEEETKKASRPSKQTAKDDQGSDNESETLVDPAAEELNDGFFDLNEMEAFADEEEEYLPDEAFGQESVDVGERDKRSFHQRQRDGDFVTADDDDDDNDEEDEEDDRDNPLHFRKITSTHRKKYRADDEIKALFSLYDKPKDDTDEDEIINMTAADLFGPPNNKYRRGGRNDKGKTPNTFAKSNEDDESWHSDQDRDLEIDAGWNVNDHETHSQSEDDDEDDDEMLHMKGSQVDQQRKGGGQSDRLIQQTEELEAELLAEKPWQMVGEAGAAQRPVNSLLDITPEFNVAAKLKPIVTIEQTAELEDIIKQRILKEDWDDVIPRELPDVGWHAKRAELPEVSQEKSKLSLGELYEREYLKKAVGYDVNAVEKQTDEEKAKSEMKSLFANLCSKLDALSNYHFAPRPVAEEAEVRPLATPAIAMEEVLPLYVSDARGAAPEEVYGAKRGRDSILRSESEKEQSDRKRIRASKKSARRKARKEKLADEKLISRLQPGTGLNNPYEKRKMREELSAARATGKVTEGQADTNDYGASGTFFARLQEEANQKIRGMVDSPEKKSKRLGAASSSALKL